MRTLNASGLRPLNDPSAFMQYLLMDENQRKVLETVLRGYAKGNVITTPFGVFPIPFGKRTTSSATPETGGGNQPLPQPRKNELYNQLIQLLILSRMMSGEGGMGTVLLLPYLSRLFGEKESK